MHVPAASLDHLSIIQEIISNGGGKRYSLARVFEQAAIPLLLFG
jgi:hypothetical protein